MALSVISSVLITFIFVFISIIALKLSAAWRHLRTLGKAIDQLPGEQIHWLWGTLHKFPGANEKGLAYGLQMTAKYGRLHRYWRTRFFPGLALYHPQTTSPIFHTAEPKPTSFGAYGLGRDWIGDGLLLSAGKKWARNRRLLTPAFHFDILKPYIKVKNDATEPLLAKMKQHAERGTPMEMFSAVSLYTFDVILRCSMSYQDDVQLQGESHPYVQAVCELGELWTARFLKPWLYNDFIYSFTAEGKKWRKCSDYVHSMSEQIITKRMEALKLSNGAEEQRRYKDFLDVLLTARDDNGKGLSFREIRDEVDTFLFEGHDTTASGISWTLYSLAQSPDCQRKCQQEVDEVLHGRDSDELSWEDLNQLKYTTMVVKEALRLHCPVPMIQRELTKDMTISGVTLPPGCHVDIAIYNLHHNPLVWTDPMTFNPDRFLPENFDKMDSFAYVPFSAGPRNCIGQHFAMHEMKIAVARLMRRYSLTLDETCTVRKKPTLVMRTENGIRMYVTARDV